MRSPTAPARATTLAGLALSTAGFALYPLVREPRHAVALATLTGTGIGAWLTGQSALLAAIVPAERRHVAFAQQRVAANLGLGLGGMCGGLLVSTTDPASFTRLFLLNAATFTVYAAFVAQVGVPGDTSPRGSGGRPALGYREVLRDRAFVRVLAIQLAFVAAAISLVNGLVPGVRPQ